MRAAIFKEPGKAWAIEAVDDPTPLAGEAVIKVGRCGICGSDLGMTAEGGHAVPCGTILGHEYSGEVVALAPGESRLRTGDIVTALPATGCGSCASCHRGEPVLCAAMQPYMGGFAEYMRIPQEGAILLPSALSLSDGALVEPLAVGLHGVRLANIATGARVLVLGAGSVGLATLYWARKFGAGTLVAASRSPRRETMSMTLGADSFVTTGDNEAERITDALGGPPDVVFECLGIPGAIGQAIGLVGSNGTIVSLGACMRPEPILSGVGTMKQVRLVFSMAYSMEEFRYVVDALNRGNVDPRLLISSTIGLDALPAMIETLRSGGNETKVHVDPGRS